VWQRGRSPWLFVPFVCQRGVFLLDTAEVAHTGSGSFEELCARQAFSVFGFSELRTEQRDVLKRIESSKNLLIMLPTGSGKTLLYALPALVWKTGITLVVCPLISLMRDQVRRMEAAGVPSALLTSDQSEDDRRAALKRARQSQLKLLFVSPERFVMPSFERSLAQANIAMVVIDEAHCVATWGHGFRPEYQQLRPVIQKLQPQKVLALTATASPHIRTVVREKVFQDPASVEQYLAPPLAKNIHVSSYRVFSETQRLEHLLEVLEKTPHNKAIVYLSRREDCSILAAELRKLKKHAVAYHAGLSSQERTATQNYLHKSEKQTVICATQAFGMGIDLPDIDLVVCHGFPGSLEDLFQMFGRAGRRGDKANAMLIWSGSDPKKRQFQFEHSYPERSLLEKVAHLLRPLLGPPGSAQVVSQIVFQKHLTDSGLVKEKQLSGVVDALRFLGLSVLPAAYEDLCSFAFSQTLSLENVRQLLPGKPTQRGALLDVLANSVTEKMATQKGVTLLVARSKLLESLGGSWEKVDRVASHYCEAGVWEWKMFAWAQLSNQIILVNNTVDLVKKLIDWSLQRGQMLQSLRELERFADAKTCRLTAAEEYYLGRSVGAQANAQKRCGRCDLCAKVEQSSQKRQGAFAFKRVVR
jgi:ATP-dependent DNA helicase RecQ